MGFSIKEITFKNQYLLYLADQTYAGPWFSFKIQGENIKDTPVILKNIEPTPVYRLVNSRSGRYINRITLDFDIHAYLRKLWRETNPPDQFELKQDKKHLIRLYIDIISRPKIPYFKTFFTLKNISDYDLKDFSMYFVFDFDINGLEGFDNDLSGYDEENDVVYQYDQTGLYGGISAISKSTHHETNLTTDFKIDINNLNLSNKIFKGAGEILSALQIGFKTLEPNHTFQTVLVISGAHSKEELFENIKFGKKNAMKFLNQVNRHVKSVQRNEQEAGFLKLNLQDAKGCD